MTLHLAFAEDMSGAEFDPPREFRFRLWRQWVDPRQRACFLMLNPSTADEVDADPTVARCINFASSWGMGALDVVNLFALVSTDPRQLYTHLRPTGDPRNLQTIVEVARHAELVIAAWGNHGKHLDRAETVLAVLKREGIDIHCFGENKDGSPKHPLYLKSDTKPVIYRRAR